MLSSPGFSFIYSGRRNAATKYIFLFFFSFLLTDNTAVLSFISSPHAFRCHLALFLFFTVVSSLSHNLFQTLPKSYSQSTCLNRHGLWCFLFIEVGPLPGDISESRAALCNAPFLFLSFIHWSTSKVHWQFLDSLSFLEVQSVMSLKKSP